MLGDAQTRSLRVALGFVHRAAAGGRASARRTDPKSLSDEVMLRTKLAVAFLGLLGPAFIMGFLLYWGPRQMEHRLERSLLAHGEVQAYLELALEAYRHLQQLELSRPCSGSRSIARRCSASRGRLTERLEALRRLTLDELAFVGETEPEERLELERIARFEALLEQAVATISAGRTGGRPRRRSAATWKRSIGSSGL